MPITDVPKPFTTAQESIYTLTLSQFSLNIEGSPGRVPIAFPVQALAPRGASEWICRVGAVHRSSLQHTPLTYLWNSHFFFFFWPCWVFIEACRLSLVAEHGLWSEDSVVEACRLSCPATRGILVSIPGSKPCTGRQILNYWTTREDPGHLKNSQWTGHRWEVRESWWHMCSCSRAVVKNIANQAASNSRSRVLSTGVWRWWG